MRKIDDMDYMWIIIGLIAAFLVFGVPALATWLGVF